MAFPFSPRCLTPCQAHCIPSKNVYCLENVSSKSQLYDEEDQSFLQKGETGRPHFLPSNLSFHLYFRQSCSELEHSTPLNCCPDLALSLIPD